MPQTWKRRERILNHHRNGLLMLNLFIAHTIYFSLSFSSLFSFDAVRYYCDNNQRESWVDSWLNTSEKIVYIFDFLLTKQIAYNRIVSVCLCEIPRILLRPEEFDLIRVYLPVFYLRYCCGTAVLCMPSSSSLILTRF